MVNKKVKKSQSKTKRKTWVTLKAPQVFGGGELGHTLVEDPKLVMGKAISANLMNLTRDPKKQGVNVRFKVSALHSSYAQTIFSNYKVMPSSIKRIVRRNKNRVDHSFKCKTADGTLLTVKPIVLTMNKCNNSVNKAIRKKVVSFIYYHFGKRTLDQVCQDIIGSKIQYALKKSLAKIYPVSICELREVSVSTYSEAVLKKAAEPKAEPKPVENPKEGEAPKKPAEEAKPVKDDSKKEEPKPAEKAEKPTEDKKEEKPEEKKPVKEKKPEEKKEEKPVEEKKAPVEKKEDKEDSKVEEPAKKKKSVDKAE
jgi:small subunit ribosomal protein S3Ae